jgi:hypothetical protein
MLDEMLIPCRSGNDHDVSSHRSTSENVKEQAAKLRRRRLVHRVPGKRTRERKKKTKKKKKKEKRNRVQENSRK